MVIEKIELNKMETSNLLDAEFKTLVIRILDEVRGRVDKLSELQQRDMAQMKEQNKTPEK